MSHPWIHAENSVKRYGGHANDYIAIHHWFDATKSWHPDWRHRCMRHHAEGIFECVSLFGDTIINTNGDRVSVYQIAQDHVIEDLGFIPSLSDWFEHFNDEGWQEFTEKKAEIRHDLQVNMTDKVPKSVIDNLRRNAK